MEESDKSVKCWKTGMTLKVKASKGLQNVVVQMIRDQYGRGATVIWIRNESYFPVVLFSRISN